jgi:hypothetical protein
VTHFLSEAMTSTFAGNLSWKYDKHIKAFILPVLYLRGNMGIISPLSPFREEMPKSSTRFTVISLSVILQSYFRFNDVPYSRTEYLYIWGLYLTASVV